MNDGAYYNEHDPYAAQWLRNLIAAGHIAPGDVDERSIVDVRADDLKGHRQCHFFAGIGVWSHALRRAGWPDDREVWSGSCPCQPFSDAGRGGAFTDERDLFPAWAALIGERRPRVIVGEQVASRVGLAWLDLVHADLEAKAYTVGAIDTCAAGFGAPHIRQRLYFVAHAGSERVRAGHGSGAGAQGAQGAHKGDRNQREWFRPDAGDGERAGGNAGVALGNASSRGRGELGDAPQPGSGRHADGADRDGVALGDTIIEGLEGHGRNERDRDQPGRHGANEAGPAAAASSADGVGLADTERDGGRADEQEREKEGRAPDGRPGPTNGFWADADWVPCRDGKARPVRPGTFPLAHGATARVGRLRAYGNAINAEQARHFIEVAMTVLP